MHTIKTIFWGDFMLETHLGGRFFCQEGEESTVCFM